MKYVYPKLPAVSCNPFFRTGGNGLANCLFVYAKAVDLSLKSGMKLIAPTWFNLSIGTYLRRQQDKRHYCGIMSSKGEVSGLKRLAILMFSKKNISKVSGIYDFFKPLLANQKQISDYIINHVCDKHKSNLDSFDFSNCVAVHVRLGDFPENRRVPMSWYIDKIKSVCQYDKVLLFSDGTDEELKELTSLPNVQRVYFGSAISDILAISRCKYIYGSDSSFSAWGAYLGQVPCSFYNFQFGKVLVDDSKQIVENKEYK